MLTVLLFVVLVVFIITVAFYLWICRYSYWGRQISKIPGNGEWPLIGHIFDIAVLDQESIFKYLREQRRIYGRIFRIRMFHLAAVNISHPDDVEKIYSTTVHNEKQIPYNFLRPWLCEGLLVSNGEKWKQRRKLLTPAFHFNILKRFCCTFNEQTERLLKKVEEETEKERTNIIPLITSATLNIMCATSMGISVQNGLETVSKTYCEAIHKLGEILTIRYLSIHFFIDWVYKLSFLARIENKLLTDIHQFTNNIIEERKAFLEKNNIKLPNFDESKVDPIGKERLAMLDLLLENEREGKIDRIGTREEVDTFLFEGHDTTAMALCFMIMRIANETEIQDKIYAELKQIFGNSERSPTTTDLNEMKYLECCIKESMRIYPSVSFMARYATQDVVLGGYTVPGGTIIHTHVYDLHHNPEIYPDPEKFDPDRFLKENIVARHPYAYIPFSAGARNCIGQKFAMLEMKTVMSGLLRRFRLDPVTRPRDVVFLGDIVLRSRDPLYVRFRKRTMT